MPTLSLITTVLVLIGAFFLSAAILKSRFVAGRVPRELHRRWVAIILLMIFFLAGYLLLAVILVSRISFPIELLTGVVFLGGAFFVFIVISLAGDTIRRIKSAETELRTLNESLEKRVLERTAELRQSHEFLKTVLDSLNEGVSIIDVRDFRVVAANRAFLEEYGLAEESLGNRTCHEITHGRQDVCSPPHDLCPLLETVKTGRYAAAEHVHYDKNGRGIYVEVSSSPIRDADGGITRIAHISRDVTTRKIAEQALRENEEQLRNLLDSVHTGVMIVDSEEQNVVDLNVYAAALIGSPRERILGRPSSAFISRAGQGDMRAPDAHEPVDHAERVLVRADGSSIPILKSVVPIRYRGRGHLVVNFIDISRLKDVEAELQQVIAAMQESEVRYRRLVELSPDGIAIHVDGRYVFMNPAGVRMLGGSGPEQVVGTAHADRVHPDFRDVAAERTRQLLNRENDAPWLEEKLIRLDGQEIDVEIAGMPFSYRGSPAVQVIFRDIGDRKQMEESLRRIALYDDLTGLPNRSLFFDRVRQLLELAKRNGFVMAVLYIDLDRFKAVNDSLGHEMGDLLLKEVARRLTSCTRKADTVARMGGDEFVGLCGKIEAADHAAVIARKIVETLSTPFRLRDHVVTIGASIGISVFPDDGSDVQTLLNRADAAMYRVKERGKGGYLLCRDLEKRAGDDGNR